MNLHTLFPWFLAAKAPAAMSLSAQLEAELRALPPDQPRTLARTGPKQILFLEDDNGLREILTQFVLPNYDAIFHPCATVEEARKILAEGPIDACLLDIRVTNGNGIELYKEIMREWPRMDVSFLTAYDMPEYLTRIGEIGPARIFSKKAMMRDPDFLKRLLAQLGVAAKTAVA